MQNSRPPLQYRHQIHRVSQSNAPLKWRNWNTTRFYKGSGVVQAYKTLAIEKPCSSASKLRTGIP